MDVVAGRPSTARRIGRRLQDVAWTLVVLVMVIVLLVFILASGRALKLVLGLLGLSGEISVWSVARWPAAAAAALLIVAIVRWASPSGPRGRFRLATPGAVVTVAAVLLETVGFDVYVSNIASYNSTYGAFAGGVILLLWIWLVAVALLFGAELDAALAERR